MNVYFDNRGGTHSYVTVFCDDELFGRVAIDRDTIYMIEIPNDVNILKVSSVAVIYEFSELDKKKIDCLDINFNKEQIRHFGFINRKWQYPYDSIIYLNGCNRDIIIYQITFPQKELAYALGYRARFLLDGNQIETKYVKRKAKFYATENRWIQMLLLFTAVVLSTIFFPDAIEAYKAAESVMGERYAIGLIGLCIFSYVFFILFFPGFLKYEEFLQESKLKSEYYLDSYGNWSSSEK